MVKHKEYILILLCTFVYCSSQADFGRQSKIKFYNLPQAQKIWDDPEILGNSTEFAHPVSLGTFTECDDMEIVNVFNTTSGSGYAFLYNYTLNGVKVNEQRSGEKGDYADISVRIVFDAAYRTAKAFRTIEKGILSAKGCVAACVTEKDFVCRDCDYFDADGGKCALYNTTGVVFNEDPSTSHPNYVGQNAASTHYFVYRKGEVPPTCNISNGGYAHPYFALGWKAMETGWYTLAHNMFDRAIAIDVNFHLAYVGKMLSNDKMGYGVKEYKDRVQAIKDAGDFDVRLSLQEQVLVNALFALQNGDDFSTGLTGMLEVFTKFEGVKDKILRVIEGNAQLLKRDIYDILNELAKDEKNVYALQLLTHNLNPYKNGKDLISEDSQAAATNAVFHYSDLAVAGAWQITADCVDISEYYARWQAGKLLLDQQKTFLFKNTNPANSEFLFGESEVNVTVHNVDVVYMTKALRRVSDYERLHFFELQLGLFKQANSTLAELDSAKTKSVEELQMQRHRMTANAYFTAYGYIYNTYAEKLVFENDWTVPINRSTSDLALASRTYYWAAAAVQKLNKLSTVEDIKTALDTAKEAASHESYKTLIDIHSTVVMGTEKLKQGNYKGALDAAEQAGQLQDQLVDANFAIEGNEDSKEFRMLIPLGFQFKADVLDALIDNEDAKAALGTSLTEQTVIDAYEQTVNTPPLNASRILRGYGVSLQRRDSEKPRMLNQPTPSYVLAFEALEKAWKNNEVEGPFSAKTESAEAVEHYYNLPISGCGANFQISSEGDGQLCWGGYVIIGVAVALVVIIAIIIGILCLRRKAKAPRRDKEKEHAFIFSGPNLSRQESFASSSRIGLQTMNKGSPEATPYASQTLSIQRPFQDNDYTQRSNTIGGIGQTGEFEAYSSH